MEEIPNITSDVIEKLKKLNINSVYQLAVQSPFELALEYEDTSVNVESASNLIANARKILTENKVLTDEFSTADEVLNIEKYRALFPHVAAAIRLNVSGAITNRGDSIQYVHTDSNHADPLQRITPVKLISAENYDKEKYLDMLLDSAEAVLSIFGFNRSLFGFDEKKSRYWWNEIYLQRERDIDSAKTEL